MLMTNLCDRVLERMKDLGGLTEDSVVAGLKKHGVVVSQPAFHKVKSGDTLKPRYMVELSYVLLCDLEWLRTGKGDKDIKGLSSGEAAISAIREAEEQYNAQPSIQDDFNALSAEDKDRVVDLIHVLSTR